jgi:hypothetical protein
LLLQVDEDLALIGVQTNVIGGEADGANGIADDLFVVDLGTSGDLTKNHDHVGLGGGFASDLGLGVLGQAGIQDRVRDLVSQLVRVSLIHGLCIEA